MPALLVGELESACNYFYDKIKIKQSQCMTSVNERLREAARAGYEIEIKVLLCNLECDASAKDEVGMTALMCAACNGHGACVKILLTKKDVLIKDDNGMTALMWAASGGHDACIMILLPKSDASTTDYDGKTALMWAAWNGQQGSASLLLPISNALAKDNSGQTASDLAHDGGHEVLAQLVERLHAISTRASRYRS